MTHARGEKPARSYTPGSIATALSYIVPRGRFCTLGVAVIGCLAVPATVAWADNCSTLSDCFGTAGAAASTVAALVVLVALGPLLTRALAGLGRTADEADVLADAKKRPSAPLTGSAEPPLPRWSEGELRRELARTTTGRTILKNLPASTKFRAYTITVGDDRNAYYKPRENAIYVPSHYSSVEATPTASHEAIHADQYVNHGRPKDRNDLIEMEVEAKNKGLDVYEEMGRPRVPYGYEIESAARSRSRKAYENEVRELYKRHYGVE